MEFDRELERLIKKKLNDPKELIAEPRRPSLNRSIVTIDGMRNNYYLPKSSYRPKYVGAPITDEYIGVYQLDSAIREEYYELGNLTNSDEHSFVLLFFITNKGWAFFGFRRLSAWMTRRSKKITCHTNKIRNLFHVYLTHENEVVLLLPYQYTIYQPFEGNLEPFYSSPEYDFIIIPENTLGQPYFINKSVLTRVFKLYKPKLSESSGLPLFRSKMGFNNSITFDNSPIFSSVFDNIDDFIVTNANLIKIPEFRYAGILNNNHKIRDYLIDIILTFNNLVRYIEDLFVYFKLDWVYPSFTPPDLIDLKTHYSWARNLNINTPLIVNYTTTPIYYPEYYSDRHLPRYNTFAIYRRSIPRFYLYKVKKVQNIEDVFNRHPEWRGELNDRIYNGYYWWLYDLPRLEYY